MFSTQIFLASMFSTQKSVLHQCFQHKKLSFNAMFSMQKNEFCTNEQKIVFQPNVFNTIIVYMNIFNTNKISIASMFLTQYTKFAPINQFPKKKQFTTKNQRAQSTKIKFNTPMWSTQKLKFSPMCQKIFSTQNFVVKYFPLKAKSPINPTCYYFLQLSGFCFGCANQFLSKKFTSSAFISDRPYGKYKLFSKTFTNFPNREVIIKKKVCLLRKDGSAKCL